MRNGRSNRRPLSAALVLAGLIGLAGCNRYEPIDVWDPENPQSPTAQRGGQGRAEPPPTDRAAAEPPPRPPPRRPVRGGRRPAPSVESAPLPAPAPPPPATASAPSQRPAPPDRPAPSERQATPERAAPSERATPPERATSPERAPPGGVVTVSSGETLFAISRRTGVPVRALIDANDLSPPYHLLAGQKITVPATRFHEVQPGETLYSVSRRFDVAMSVLVRENRLEAPYGVRSGQRLKIPPAVEEPETQVAAAPSTGVLRLPPGHPAEPPRPGPDQVLRLPPSAQPQAPAQPQPQPPATEEPPAPPQTGFLTPPPGAEPAAPTSPSGVEPILPPQRPGRAPTDDASPAPEPPARPDGGRRPERTAPPAVAMAPPPVQPAVVSPPRPPVDAGAPPPREGRFVWPVRGRIVTRFGPTGRGLHNDGINIAAPRGSTVVAAETGVVAYAGNELRGFGNLLLIKHADGWITAYAHNEALLVRRGERVRRGQPIARVGQTGNVGQPQLHFELRRGTRAIDPSEHLGSQVTAIEAPPDGDPAAPPFRTRRAVLLAARPDPG